MGILHLWPGAFLFKIFRGASSDTVDLIKLEYLTVYGRASMGS